MISYSHQSRAFIIFVHTPNESRWVLKTLVCTNYNRADPGEVRRALPEDNRTNRRSHAFRSQYFVRCISTRWYPASFQEKTKCSGIFSKRWRGLTRRLALRAQHCIVHDMTKYIVYQMTKYISYNMTKYI